MAVGAHDADSQGVLVAREKDKLRKVLGRFDLILFMACALVGLESVVLAAQAGAQAITWLLPMDEYREDMVCPALVLDRPARRLAPSWRSADAGRPHSRPDGTCSRSAEPRSRQTAPS
jgi:hypothetical protein